MIGAALCSYEEHLNVYRLGFSGAQREFQESVAFVPLEVLEAYLEDLLDEHVSEDRLFLKARHSMIRRTALIGVGLIGSLVAGLSAVANGLSSIFALLLTVALALPFVWLWHVAPTRGLARRMSFAQIVSKEIARRRGGGNRVASEVKQSFSFRGLLNPKAPESAREVIARVIH